MVCYSTSGAGDGCVGVDTFRFKPAIRVSQKVAITVVVDDANYTGTYKSGQGNGTKLNYYTPKGDLVGMFDRLQIS